MSKNSGGLTVWKDVYDEVSYSADETAFVIVDMWDKHWSTGAVLRGEPIAAQINHLAAKLRDKGVRVVHAPSDTMGFYVNSKARERLLKTQPLADIPIVREIKDYPQPITVINGGTDTRDIDRYAENTGVWKRQTAIIEIDEERDLVGDEGDLLFAYFKEKGIKNVLYAGVHTNMCVLGRSFAIKKMLSRGMNAVLIRDLTDSMYSPEHPPYVSHEEGTRLIVEYIEKFYCPTITSGQLYYN
jgi:nicotinamidase-related amidase